MRTFNALLVFMASFAPSVLYADTLRVVTDIAPVHSLVAQIMDGVGEPDLLLPASASPHDYAMRPSDARLLQDANAVFWVGNALTPWLSQALESLSGEAVKIELLEAEGTMRVNFREGAVFAKAEDDHEHDHDHTHNDHGHEDEDDHDDHAHSGVDPHAWLDPSNAKIWLGVITRELSALDPENAKLYQGNLSKAQASIDVLTATLANKLEGADDLRFVVLHDGYRYFEDRFGMQAVGAVSESDASAPSAGRVRDIREAIENEGISCLFTEAQLQSPLLEIIASETDTTVVTLDPLGSLFAPGKDLYAQTMNAIAASFDACR